MYTLVVTSPLVDVGAGKAKGRREEFQMRTLYIASFYLALLLQPVAGGEAVYQVGGQVLAKKLDRSILSTGALVGSIMSPVGSVIGVFG